MESATAPRVLGLAASTILQGIWRKLYPLMPPVTDLLNLDLLDLVEGPDVISVPPN